MSGPVEITSAAFVLAVPDARRSGRWWTETFGFEAWFETDGFHFVRSGACTLRFGSCPGALPPADLGDHGYFGYFEVAKINDLHDRLAERSVDVISPPSDRPWGMREMGIRTPDGHRVMLAERIG